MADGTKRRATTSKDLDFSGVFGGEGKPAPPPEREEPAKGLAMEARKKEKDRQESLGVYQTYQKNIIATSNLQTEILQGIVAGESMVTLLLKAARAISLMTDNPLFYSQVERDIGAIYGEGLRQEEPLQKLIEDTEERLGKLREALELFPEESREIQRAIRSHEERLGMLENAKNHTL